MGVNYWLADGLQLQCQPAGELKTDVGYVRVSVRNKVVIVIAMHDAVAPKSTPRSHDFLTKLLCLQLSRGITLDKETWIGRGKG